MQITWFGLSSFKITGKDITIITDPFGSSTGLSPVRGGADIVISTDPAHPWCNNFSSITGQPFIVTGPGEYDIKGAFIMGAKAGAEGKQALYQIELEDIRIAFLGPIKQKELSDHQKETLEGADIVLIPVGGGDTIDFNDAVKISAKLEPFIIVPHSYKTAGVSANLDKLDKFLKEMGGKYTEEEKISLKKKDLAGESTSLIVLTPQR
jgi:L-ascorbate metabolism protein UlaG (beta-lactamase superfamily)